MTATQVLSPQQLLISTGSITAQLRAACNQLSVDLVWQGDTALTAIEQQWLGYNGRGWGREVCLRGDGMPWLVARTVAPQSALSLVAGLRRLGDAPLGDWLFGAAAAQRTRLETLSAQEPLPLSLPAGVHSWWGRRSLFINSEGEPLLVSEWLLSGYPQKGGAQ